MNKKMHTFIFVFAFAILSFIMTYPATGFSAEVFQVASNEESTEIQQLRDSATELRDEAKALREEATELQDKATRLRDKNREIEAMKLEDKAMDLEARAIDLESEADDVLFEAEEILWQTEFEKRKGKSEHPQRPDEIMNDQRQG